MAVHLHFRHLWQAQSPSSEVQCHCHPHHDEYRLYLLLYPCMLILIIQPVKAKDISGVVDIYSRLNLHLDKSIARALLARVPHPF